MVLKIEDVLSLVYFADPMFAGMAGSNFIFVPFCVNFHTVILLSIKQLSILRY